MRARAKAAGPLGYFANISRRSRTPVRSTRASAPCAAVICRPIGSISWTGIGIEIAGEFMLALSTMVALVP